MNIQPVILCGGSGTRLWPLSREQYPKQLLALNGELTLLQATARRVDSFVPAPAAPLVALKPVQDAPKPTAEKPATAPTRRPAPVPAPGAPTPSNPAGIKF